MQNTLSALLLITASVILCCIVIDYAVGVVQTTVQTDDNPQLQHLRNLETSILNQTYNLENQTIPTPQETLPP